MQNAIDILRGLQELDLEMQRAGRALEEAEAEVASETRAMEAAVAGLERAREEVRKMQMEVDRRNSELKGKEEAITRMEGQLMSLKSNEEYAAMRRQIEDRRAQTSKEEEEILEAMEAVEQRGASVAESSREVEERRRAKDSAEKRLAQRRQELEGRLADLRRRWEEQAQGLDPEVRDTYVEVRDHRDGRGVAQLSPDGLCQGCYVQLRPQILNALMGGKLVSCPSCQRFLYMA